jgi:hypothetical protein
MNKGILVAIIIILVLGLVLILACAGLIGGVFWLTKGPAEAADRFIALLGEGKTKEAYASAATLLRNQQTEADFAAAVKQMGLLDAASSSWPTRSIVNNEAKLEGTVTTKGGGTIPVKARLVKEGEEWRILELTVPQAQVKVGDQTKPPIPADAELRKMATATVLDFDQAVKAKDFAVFYGKIAKLWQSQTKPEELKKIFQQFIDKDVDLSGIKEVPPEFSEPPGLDADHMLALTGYYPAKTLRVNFKLRYAYEHPAWKLVGIEINIVPQPKPEKE